MGKLPKWLLIGAALAMISVALVGVGAYAWIDRRSVLAWVEAKAAFDAGENARAKQLLEQMIQQDPSREEAYRLLAQLAEQEKNYYTALSCWHSVELLDPFDIEAQVRQMQMLEELGEFHAIQVILAKKADSGTLNSRLLPFYAEAEAEVGAPGSAQKLIDEAKLDARGDDLTRLEIARAALALRDRNYGRAEFLYRSVAAIPGFRWRGVIGEGDVALRRGDLARAEACYQRAAELSPERTALLLARFYRSRGELRKAEEFYREELQRNPRNIRAVAGLAELLAGRSEYGQLKELQSHFSPNGRMGVETSYYLDALAACGDGDYAAANDALQLCPMYRSRPIYRLMRLKIDLELHDETALMNDFRIVAAALPESPEARRELSSLLLPMLERAVADGDDARAAEVARLIYEAAPGESVPRRSAVRVLMLDAFSARAWQSAQNWAQELLGQDAKDEVALKVMAESLLQENRFALALNYFRKLPPSREALLGQALAQAGLLRNTEAVASLREAWVIAPGNPETLEAAGRLLMEFRQWELLRRWTDETIAMHPDAYRAWQLSGDASAAAGKPLVAREARLRAIQLLLTLPRTPENRFDLAYLYASTDQDQLAAVEYEELLRQRPDWDWVLVNLSEVKAALGEHRAALEYARKAFRLYPGWNIAAECLDRRRAEEKRGGK